VHVRPEIASAKIEPGDFLVTASDGLTENTTDTWHRET
jgi:serine/threonine protein phosphatase PrpC